MKMSIYEGRRDEAAVHVDFTRRLRVDARGSMATMRPSRTTMSAPLCPSGSVADAEVEGHGGITIG